jgi:hypothetical protein
MRTRDEYHRAARPRCGDVQAIGIVEELEAARSILGLGRRHTIDDDRSFLTLKPVHGSDTRVGQTFTEPVDLRIVR